MTRTEIIDKIKEIVFEIEPDLENRDIQEDTVINHDAAIDSMGFTLAICRLEAYFDVRIPDRQWAKLQTLGDVADAIEKRLNKK
ncbi:MAG: acyl carrier protein [Lachnospiraceae bacterium]|nr:acyl carrier protein [Lachnospiraceae bacterium]